MSTGVLTPYEMAEVLCITQNARIEDQRAYFERHGFIFSGPKFLIFAEEIGSSWAVFIAIGEGCLPLFLQAMPWWKPNISFARSLRSRHSMRTYPTERICRLLHMDPEPLKQRTCPTTDSFSAS